MKNSNKNGNNGFKNVITNTIKCLEQGNIINELRDDIDLKNLLATDEIDIDTLITILKKTKGNEYENSLHHSYNSNITIHIVKTKFSNINWYIKWYFIEPNVVFISVHN